MVDFTMGVEAPSAPNSPGGGLLSLEVFLPVVPLNPIVLGPDIGVVFMQPRRCV